MRGDPSDHEPEMDPQGIWQAQSKEYDPMTLAQIHAKARKFESRVQWRNAVEYVACGVVIVGFSPALLSGPNWMMRVGAALIMLATIYVGWQLHRRGSVEASPQPDETLVDAYRRQLIRQREALRTIATWYLAPFVPCMALFLVGMWFVTPKRGTVERFHIGLLIVALVWVLICVVIWLLNQRGARLLQKRIDEL